MRKKVSPASSCTAPVVGCSLLNLIFNHNSTTENHSLTTNPQGHFQASCKSWKGCRDLGSSPHLCTNIHFKGLDIKILLSPILLLVTMSVDSMWLPLQKRNLAHCLHENDVWFVYTGALQERMPNGNSEICNKMGRQTSSALQKESLFCRAGSVINIASAARLLALKINRLEVIKANVSNSRFQTRNPGAP